MDGAFHQRGIYPTCACPENYIPFNKESIFLVSDHGEVNEITPYYQIEYFREITEDEEVSMFPKGCAIACATLLTVIGVIYLIIKWNS
jgi:hypothetical protein